MPSFQTILADILKVISASQPLPDVKDREAVKAFLARLTPPTVDLIYDFGIDAVEAALAAAKPADWKVEAAKLPAGKPGAMDWTQLIALIPTVVAFIKAMVEAWKKIKPAPVNDNCPHT